MFQVDSITKINLLLNLKIFLERDIGMSSNSNYNQQMNKVPLWYQNLKAKKQI